MADDLDKKEAPPEAFSSRSSLDSGKKGKPSTSAKVREVMKMKTKKDKIRMAVAITLCLVVIAGIITGAVLGAKAAKDKDKETTQPPPTTEPPTQPSYRLPDDLKPIQYWVSLQPMVNGNFSIYGDVTVEMQVMKATTNITLHIVDIITKNNTVKVTTRQTEDGPETAVTVSKQLYDAEREFYIAMLDEELTVDSWVTFSISFEGLLNDQMRGFYRSSYTAPDGSTKWLGVTQFQADDARMAFPCMDEPALKAKFTISLARETNMSAISNMPLSDTVDIEDQPGWVWDHFQTSVPMSTYLVAFMVSDFGYLNDGNFSVWAREEFVNQTQEALDMGPPILEYYEEYFNISYPLPKTDMAAIPDFSAGAMENWGLITYREEYLLLPPGASASVHQRVVVIVAHELAHQWFGNLVTPTWWTDIWLNEGFASYLEHLGTHHMYPEWQMLQQMSLTMQDVMIADGLPSTHPVSQPVEHPDDIGQIFDSIAYDKGMSIIRMMNHFLTEETFRTGLTNYLNHFAYGAAEQDDLWDHLTQAANADGQDTLPAGVTVKDIMDTWTLQDGYPVLTVTRTEAGTQATVSQQRFLLAGNSSGADGQGSWWVPVSYTSANAPNFTVTSPALWIAKDVPTIAVTSLPAKEHWVIFNIQGTAYYRVNYDAENWARISTQLVTDHAVIDAATRSQLIDDALSLARGGYLNYETALGLVNYMDQETEFVPWSAALDGLSYLEQMLTRSGAYGDFRRYMISILQPLYDNVGFVDSTNDLHLDQYKRSLAVSWACKMEHEDCLTNARTAFDLWINNDTEVSANIKAAVYCTGVYEGGQEAWEAVWERYLDSEVASEKTHLLNALGCSNEIWLLSRYLDWAFTEESGIRKMDSRRVFSAVASNDVSRSMAWLFLRNELDRIMTFYGEPSSVSSLISSATAEFNTEIEKYELETFYKENQDTLSAATRTIQEALDRTDGNIAWMEKNYEVIRQWLEDNYPAGI